MSEEQPTEQEEQPTEQELAEYRDWKANQPSPRTAADEAYDSEFPPGSQVRQEKDREETPQETQEQANEQEDVPWPT